MRKLLLLSIVCVTLQAQARIWRVNNNPSLDGDVLQGSTLFDNINNATNPEAAANDTVYFEPSASSYQGFDINKANIVIIGYGYFLSNYPNTQAMTNNARIDNVYFQNGSTGSTISGIEITGSVYFYTGNVTLTRSRVPTIYMAHQANATGVRIDKCFITSGIFDGGLGAAATNVNIAVENCIFSGVGDGNFISGISLPNKVRGLLRNNVFNYCSTNYYFNFYVANNIYTYQTTWGGVSNSGNNVFRNNIFSYPASTAAYAQVGGNTLPNSGNQFAVNLATVFRGNTDNVYNAGTNTYNNYILLGTFTPESRFELDPTPNPAVAAGEGGTTVGGAPVTTPDCGAYGATDPYRKAGFPNIPRIYSLTVPATVPNGSATMQISVSSTRNN
jgi:hypothetical protein